MRSTVRAGLTVSVVGFGYIGTCIGALLASKGHKVYGIDTNQKVVEEINRGTTSIEEPLLEALVRDAHDRNNLEAATKYDAVATSDIVIVTVGTPLAQDNAPDLAPVESACASIGAKLQPGSLVIVKSTVPPQSTERWVKDILESRSGLVEGEHFGLAYCPERISEGNAIQELQRIPVVVGACDPVSSNLAAVFWQEALGVETVKVGSPTTAEMVKLADNQWIDLNVALANEVALISDKLNIDALEVIRAANSLPKGQYHINILSPGIGVGGYCLPKDPWFFHKIGKDHGVQIETTLCSRTVNDRMPEASFDMVRECLGNINKELSSSRVAVLGLAYKNNTGDVRSTPVAPFINLLEQSGCSITVFDPLVNEGNIRGMTNARIGLDVLSTVEGADLIAFMTAHEQFKETPLGLLKERTNPACWFFDGRHGFDPKAVAEAGFIYTGIGRKCYSVEPVQ